MSAKRKPRLGPAQWALLDRICRTNGGGISDARVDDSDRRRLRRLTELGLIQPKSGADWCFVHTREGLNIWRGVSGDGA